jgi:hypothetical protein
MATASQLAGITEPPMYRTQSYVEKLLAEAQAELAELKAGKPLAAARPATAAEAYDATPKASALQVGGDHYKKLAIQPAEYAQKNRLGFIEGCVIKYVTRWRDKGGVEDIKKAIHFLNLLIELEAEGDE